MPVSLCGSWDMVSNVNLEGYMIALGKSPILLPVEMDNYLLFCCYDLYIL